jgi:hypothetical protein
VVRLRERAHRAFVRYGKRPDAVKQHRAVVEMVANLSGWEAYLPQRQRSGEEFVVPAWGGSPDRVSFFRFAWAGQFLPRG